MDNTARSRQSYAGPPTTRTENESNDSKQPSRPGTALGHNSRRSSMLPQTKRTTGKSKLDERPPWRWDILLFFLFFFFFTLDSLLDVVLIFCTGYNLGVGVGVYIPDSHQALLLLSVNLSHYCIQHCTVVCGLVWSLLSVHNHPTMVQTKGLIWSRVKMKPCSAVTFPDTNFSFKKELSITEI